MADRLTSAKRSWNMSRVRSKDTTLELVVRKFLFSKGFRYRIHAKHLPGTPDLIFGKFRIAIFIHGCFWHGHEGCKLASTPKTRTRWWQEKIDSNRRRDERNATALQMTGWNVVTIYGCELTPAKRDRTLHKLQSLLSHRRGISDSE